jgi:hypothetical protein
MHVTFTVPLGFADCYLLFGGATRQLAHRLLCKVLFDLVVTVCGQL